MKIPFVGPSYQLRTRKADVQRSVNLFPSIVESQTGKAPGILQSVDGLVEFTDLGAPIRGFCFAQGRLFAVAGDTLYEVDSGGGSVSRGALHTSTGAVGMDKNRTQVIVTDGDGYTLTLLTNTFAEITTAAFYGSDLVSVVNGVAVFKRPDTDTFYWSAIDDAQTIDALDFATAENSPDVIVGHIVDHGQVFFFGEEGSEVWDYVGGTDEFSKNTGAQIQVGCAAKHSIRQIDNSVMWLGRDKQGAGIVWRMNGYTPVRVSTQAIEQVLQAGDMSEAIAMTYQKDGHSFYQLYVPGVETSWCYDVSTQQWHERAEWADGFLPSRAKYHVFAFDKHIVGGDDGKLYYYDAETYTNGGDVLLRERISPYLAQPGMQKLALSSFEIECDTGEGAGSELLMVSYSKNGGRTWSNWHYPSLGATGQWNQRVRLLRIGQARDWVFRVRCTDDTPFNVMGAIAS